MITVEKAFEIVMANAPPPHIKKVEILEAAGRIVAEDIRAREPSPRYSNSAMDGFAVRSDDVRAASEGAPVRLKIVGESKAGEPFFGVMRAGEAVQINTGAMIPEGADAVIPVENVGLEEGELVVSRPVKRHAHIRFEGEEYAEGELLIRSGEMITPAAIGLLASQGIRFVSVFGLPYVSILVTGTELRNAEAEDIEPWQIRDSNGPMLTAAVQSSGGMVVFRDRAGDQFEEIRNQIELAAEMADILLISGGVSMGPHDLVRKAAESAGFAPLFWKVRQKPGKPLYVARRENQLLFGLPGNPVSALTCFLYYVYPVLQKQMGKTFRWRTLTGKLTEEVSNKGERTLFHQVKIASQEGIVQVTPLQKQGSHMLTSIKDAEGFIFVSPQGKLRIGEKVEVYLYPWRL